MAVLGRCEPSQQRGDGPRAVAEHRAERLAVRKHIGEEVAAVQQAPAQRIDEDEDLDAAVPAHAPCSTTGAPGREAWSATRSRFGG